MLNYTIRRTFQALPLLLLISVMMFLILNKMPGGPLAAYMQNPHITAADIARLKHNFGLDRPLYVQYLDWLGHALRGDLGWSQVNSTTVVEAMKERLPATFELMSVSFVVALVVGVAFGLIAAIKPYSGFDYFVTTFAFFGMSMPVFWLAIMMQMLFSVNGIHFPPAGMERYTFGYRLDFQLPSAGDVSTGGGDFWDHLRHLIMPATCLALLQIATWSRFTRASMQEVLHTDYMRTAAAKGLTFANMIIKHGMKNGLMPVVTIIALSLPSLVSGAVVTETIFAWPGMGRLFIVGLLQQDFALLMGYLMLVSVLVVAFNLFADLVYGWLDPRVKYD
jgi:peptide/nickel transport system permease protein